MLQEEMRLDQCRKLCKLHSVVSSSLHVDVAHGQFRTDQRSPGRSTRVIEPSQAMKTIYKAQPELDIWLLPSLLIFQTTTLYIQHDGRTKEHPNLCFQPRSPRSAYGHHFRASKTAQLGFGMTFDHHILKTAINQTISGP